MLFVPNLLIRQSCSINIFRERYIEPIFLSNSFYSFLIIISRTIFRKGLKKYESAGR